MTTARRKDRVQHISGEELPAEVWLIVYMHGGIDGKHARRLAHVCMQMCAAATAHEDNNTPAQAAQLSTDRSTSSAASGDVAQSGIDGKHARRLAHACSQMCAAAAAHEDNTTKASVQQRSAVSFTGLFGESDCDSDEE